MMFMLHLSTYWYCTNIFAMEIFAMNARDRVMVDLNLDIDILVK